MTEMTELEIAQRTRTVLFWACHAGESVGHSGLDLRGVYEHWQSRVGELEVAEKEAQAIDEPKHDLVLDRLADLERRFEKHGHRDSAGFVTNDLYVNGVLSHL